MADVDIFIGFDAKEMRAHSVATTSLHLHSGHTQRVQRICRLYLFKWYTRPTKNTENGLWDVVSNAPMSTDHALARFFIPYLKEYQGWALFTDGDVLFRRDIRELLELRDERYAVQVVQHPELREVGTKKRGDYQLPYPRKNWSSVILFNCAHPSNRALDPGDADLEGFRHGMLNSWPGRDLHAFKWLKDEEIGALPAEWNYLVKVNDHQTDPALVHYTTGTPDVPGHETDQFADEWFIVAKAAGYSLSRSA